MDYEKNQFESDWDLLIEFKTSLGAMLIVPESLIRNRQKSLMAFATWWKEHSVWFGLVGFYGTSTIIGYLMPNLLHIYIYIYIYIYMIWFRKVLWHINHCRLFNAKFSLYIYIKYIFFWSGWVLWHINHYMLLNAKCIFIHIKFHFKWFSLAKVQSLNDKNSSISSYSV